MKKNINNEIKNISEDYHNRILFTCTTDQEYKILAANAINRLKKNSPEAFVYPSVDKNVPITYTLTDSLHTFNINVYSGSGMYDYLVEIYIRNILTEENAIVYEQYDSSNKMCSPLEVINMGVVLVDDKKLTKKKIINNVIVFFFDLCYILIYR